MHAKPSTGALILTIVALVTRCTDALAVKATAFCTITTKAFMCAVNTKPAVSARSLAALAFESGCASAHACHVITSSTVLAGALFGTVTPIQSLGTDTLAVDTRESI